MIAKTKRPTPAPILAKTKAGTKGGYNSAITQCIEVPKLSCPGSRKWIRKNISELRTPQNNGPLTLWHESKKMNRKI